MNEEIFYACQKPPIAFYFIELRQIPANTHICACHLPDALVVHSSAFVEQ